MKRKAWAIKIGENRYIGPYWWFGKTPHRIPTHMQGTKIALFETRAAARKALPDTKGSYPKAKVVQVLVSIQQIER